MRIYCVEDDNSIRELVVYTLNHSGYEAQGFESAEPFWQAMADPDTSGPDLILLDIMLPGQDGFSILKQLKAQTQTADLPVIMLTANAVVGAKENYLEEGFTNYLPKPIRERELMEMLRRYLPEELIKKKRIQGRGTRSLWIHKSGAESRRPQSRKTRNERMWNSMLIQRNRSPWRGVSQVLIFRWQWAIA